MAARRFRMTTSIIYSLDKDAIAGNGGSISSTTVSTEIAHASIEKLARGLAKKQLTIDATLEADTLDALATAAIAMFKSGLPAGISGFMVNDSRPTGIPGVWLRTPGEYWLHPVAAQGTSPIEVAYSNGRTKSAPRDVWACAALMAYEL